MLDKILFIIPQYIIPKHVLSNLVGILAKTEISYIKNFIIKSFIKIYGVNMKEAYTEDIESFSSFNAFFTRRLKSNARSIDSDQSSVVSPVDGKISQIGRIGNSSIIQAKGKKYSLVRFLGGDKSLSDKFKFGLFSTIYLSPKDYHRIHMPYDGRLQQMIYVPGELFSVNPITVENIDNLFAKNERLVCIFDTSYGQMAIVLVGAMIVSGIKVKWENSFENVKKIKKYNYPTFGKDQIRIKKGEELGRFLLGSTVVICFTQNKLSWLNNLVPKSKIKMGQVIGGHE